MTQQASSDDMIALVWYFFNVDESDIIAVTVQRKLYKKLFDCYLLSWCPVAILIETFQSKVASLQWNKPFRLDVASQVMIFVNGPFSPSFLIFVSLIQLKGYT